MLQPTDYSWQGATVYRHPDYKDTLYVVYQRLPLPKKDGSLLHFTPHVIGIWCPEGYWKTQDWRGEAYGCTPPIDPPTEGVRIRNYDTLHVPADLVSATGC